MSIQHMVSSLEDIITYEEGTGFFYRIDFRVKILWVLLTIVTCVISVDMVFTFYLLIFTLLLQKFGRSPVFSKIKNNKALITFSFALIIVTFAFSSLNRAILQRVMTPVDWFFFLQRAMALGFIAISVGTLFMSILQSTRTIEMTAGRGPITAILTFLIFRSVPLVAYHLGNVIDSQRARGLEMERLTPMAVIRSIKAIFIPLLIVLTGSIDRTSKVLEARGINPRVKQKSSYIEAKIRKLDVLLLFYIFSQVIVSLIVAYYFPPGYPTTTLT
ncbi:MAG: energy-coupling factor transporter transmembrane component T family protein, partial [Candidatus Hodarchaeales archaeon]